MVYKYDLGARAITTQEQTWYNLDSFAGINNADELKQMVKDAFVAEMGSNIIQGFTDQGITVTAVYLTEATVTLKQRVGWEYWFGIPIVQRTFVKARIEWKATIETEQPIHGQSLITTAVWVVKQLAPKIALLLAVVLGAWIINNFLKSLVTETYWYKLYDEEGNLIEEGGGQKPSDNPMGYILILLVVVVILFAFMGSRRK